MNLQQIVTPFTEEQVKNLNQYQEDGFMHPFTCCSSGSDSKCERKNGISEGILIASKDGWVCPCGEHTQKWAHAFMAEKKIST